MSRSPDRGVGTVLSIAEASSLRWAVEVLRNPSHPDRLEARDLLHRVLGTSYNPTPAPESKRKAR